MSYCVNCGVKLDDSLQKCPLCSTPVINPVSPYNPDAEKVWPTNEDNLSTKEDKHKIAGLISLTLGIIAVICTAVNLIYSPEAVYDHTKIWALYVVGAMALIWTLIVPCLLINKFRAIIYIGLDAIATAGFLWLVQWMTNGNWFLSLALPIVGIVAVILWIAAILTVYVKISKVYTASIVVMATALLMIALEAVIDNFVTGTVSLEWSLFVLIPAVIIAFFMAVIGRRRKFKEELRKRLHI